MKPSIEHAELLADLPTDARDLIAGYVDDSAHGLGDEYLEAMGVDNWFTVVEILADYVVNGGHDDSDVVADFVITLDL